MALKVVVFYNQYNQGWTETYYVAGTQSPQSFIAANSPKTWFPFVSFRHSSTVLYGVRASQIGSPRVAQTYVFNGNNALSGTDITPIPSAPLGADPTTTDAFCDFYTNGYQRRPLYVRGLNDQDVSRNPDGTSAPSAYLTTGLNGMATAAIAKGFCIQTLFVPQPGSNLRFGVTSLNANAATLNWTDITLTGSIVVPTIGVTQYTFQGVNRDDLPGFPRTATIVKYQGSAVNPVITIPYRLRVSGALPYIPPRMTTYATTYNYLPLYVLQYIKFAERKTGRPIGASRGRARSVVRAL